MNLNLGIQHDEQGRDVPTAVPLDFNGYFRFDRQDESHEMFWVRVRSFLSYFASSYVNMNMSWDFAPWVMSHVIILYFHFIYWIKTQTIKIIYIVYVNLWRRTTNEAFESSEFRPTSSTAPLAFVVWWLLMMTEVTSLASLTWTCQRIPTVRESAVIASKNLGQKIRTLTYFALGSGFRMGFVSSGRAVLAFWPNIFKGYIKLILGALVSSHTKLGTVIVIAIADRSCPVPVLDSGLFGQYKDVCFVIDSVLLMVVQSLISVSDLSHSKSPDCRHDSTWTSWQHPQAIKLLWPAG